MAHDKDIAKAAALVEEAVEIMNSILQERAEFFDGKSERWQEGDKGQEYQEKTDEYQSALDELENASGTLSGLVEAAS